MATGWNQSGPVLPLAALGQVWSEAGHKAVSQLLEALPVSRVLAEEHEG